jgi:hypothetical protein
MENQASTTRTVAQILNQMLLDPSLKRRATAIGSPVSVDTGVGPRA